MFSLIFRPRGSNASTGRSQTRRLIPRLELLEERCLLSASIVDFALTPESSPFGITTAPDGNIWFTEEGTSRIGSMNPTTHAISEYPIPTSRSAPIGIAAGPGGIWFTEQAANQIGVLNLSTDLISEFPIPTAGSSPAGITAGPDGNIWFTEQAANQIGMLSLSTGVITQIAIPTANTAPAAITAGPDGNLWFTQNNGNLIGMINPATGAISEYATPTGGSGPCGITVGPGNNIWFTESNANCIGELNLQTKAVSQFVIPTPGSNPRAIAAGPDGNLWFIEANTNAIGSFDPTTEAFSQIPIPVAGAMPGWLTAGPGGSLWFTETNGQQIGEIVAPPSITTAPANQTVTEGQTATFSAAATTGIPAPSVSWRVSTNGGVTFTRLTNGGLYSGIASDKLTITGPTTAMNGYEFEAVFSNGIGPTVTTSPVTLTVNGVLAVPAFPQGIIGTSYSHTVTVVASAAALRLLSISNFNAGGTGLTADDITTNVASGAITISGMPTAAGTASFTIAAADGAGNNLTQTMTVIIRAPLSIGTPSLAPADVDQKYSATINVVGGVLPYTSLSVTHFSAGGTGLTAGDITVLPITGAVQINGTPTAAGAATFTVSVVDGVGTSVTKSYTITVNPALAVKGTLPDATAGTGYYQVLTAAGGSMPYTSVAVSYFNAGTTGLNSGDIITNPVAGTCTINGTPAAAGTLSFTVNVVDGIGTLLSKTYAVTVNPALTITPALLPRGTAGVNYQKTITVAGGTTPYTSLAIAGFSAGTTGLTAAAIATNGKAGTIAINGTPTSAGTLSFSVNVIDMAHSVLTKTYSITIDPPGTKPSTPPLGISTLSLPQADVGATYDESIHVIGGALPYKAFSVTGFNGGTTGLTASDIGALPATGVFQIDGTARNTGTATFAVKVTDTNGVSVTKSYTITVNPALALTSGLAQGTAGTLYSQVLVASGGAAPYASITVNRFNSGTTGLNIAAITTNAVAGTCTIEATPLAAGTLSFTVHVVDSTGTLLSKSYTVKINAALASKPASLPEGTAGDMYHQTITVAGGTTPYTIFAVTGFSAGTTGLTAGSIVANGGTGTIAISGTPTAPGTVVFNVNVTDSAHSTLTRMYSITINSAPTLGNLSVAQWTEGAVGFSGTLSIAGGPGPYRITGYTGLPTGLTAILTGNTIAFAGARRAAARTFGSSVTIQDAAGASVTQTFNITIKLPPTIGNLTTKPWIAGIDNFTGALTVAGGIGAYSIATSHGLPTGLTPVLIDNTIRFAGTPTAAGTFTGSVTVHDATGAAVTKTFMITIKPALTITASLPDGTAGASYHRTIRVSGGLAPYTTVTVTNYSAGTTGLSAAALTIDAAAGTIVLSGTPSAAGTVAFIVNATDSAGSHLTHGYSVTINAAPVIGDVSGTQWTMGKAGFTGVMTIYGGTGPYSIAGATGLPTGLTAVVTGNTIHFTGAPTTAATYDARVAIRDARGAHIGKSFGITINAAPTIGNLTAAQWTAGIGDFTGAMTVAGGTGAFSIAKSHGLPTGLTPVLIDNTIRFAGTPTAAGTFAGSVTLHDATGAAVTKTFTITINAAPTISTLTKAAWTVDKPGFSGVIHLAGGTGHFVISSVSGLPAGLTAVVIGKTIHFTGTPTTVATYAAGSITLHDATGASVTRTFSITINPAVDIATTSLPPLKMGVRYAASLEATGGTGAVTYAVTTGSLPPVLTLSSTGVISGVPSGTGSFTFTITATDAAGAKASKEYTLSLG